MKFHGIEMVGSMLLEPKSELPEDLDTKRLIYNTSNNHLYYGGANSWERVSTMSIETSAPTETDDFLNGYLDGHVWINSITERAYLCLKNTPNNAVWIRISGWGEILELTEIRDDDFILFQRYEDEDRIYKIKVSSLFIGGGTSPVTPDPDNLYDGEYFTTLPGEYTTGINGMSYSPSHPQYDPDYLALVPDDNHTPLNVDCGTF